MNYIFIGKSMAIPNLFIIGSAKSGTTALFEMLKNHPDVFMPVNKEPQFFCNDGLYEKGLDYYLNTFYKNSDNIDVVVDATPHYMYFEKVAKRLSSDLKSVDKKFIVVLRNPIDRAYSLYWNMVKEGVEDLSFEEALASEETRLNDMDLSANCSLLYSYVDSGLYSKQLKAYFKYFDREDFLILFQEDLNAKSNEVYASICNFLGIKTNKIDSLGRHNESAVTRYKFVHSFLRGESIIKRSLGLFFPHSLKYKIVDFLIKFNSKKFKYPAMNEETEDHLKNVFRTEIDELGRLLNKDLSRWLN